MRRSYKYLMLALVIADARAAQQEFDARETLERAKVGIYSPRMQPRVRVVVEDSPEFPAPRYRKNHSQQRIERMNCKLDSSTNSMRCVRNRPKK